MASPAAQTDRDLASIAEARTLVRRAKEVAPVLAEFSQQQIDAVVDACAAVATAHAEPLARLAHEETGYGVAADKVQKNLFASQKVYEFIKPMKTVGVIRRLDAAGSAKVLAGIQVLTKTPYSLWLKKVGLQGGLASSWATSSGSMRYDYVDAVLLVPESEALARDPVIVMRPLPISALPRQA